jgi:hypothetical protein
MPKPKTPIARLPFKTSAMWSNEAPYGAAGLIVAECSTADRRSPNRRVALGWALQNADPAQQLRSAASKFVETAELSESGKEVEEFQATGTCLRSSNRAAVQWTVRVVPVGIIQCWAGYEDATAAAAATTKSESSSTAPAAAKAMATAVNDQPSAGSRATTLNERPGSVGADALPVFAPMSALILDRKRGFQGSCAYPDSPFITDGRTMLLRSCCNQDFVSKMKGITIGNYGPKNPVPDHRSETIFKAAVQDAVYVGVIHGYILGADAQFSGKSDDPLACVTGPGDKVVVLDGHRLRLIQNVTGANVIRVSAESEITKVVLFKDATPVAVQIAFTLPEVAKQFSRMIAQAGMRTIENRSKTPIPIQASPRRIAG